MLDNFKDYYNKARMMQELKFQGGNHTKQDINDDLVWNVPIYDVVNRRFAAFSSLPEAIIHRLDDPKGNGKYFHHLDTMEDLQFAKLCYLFRLCGSGINYVPTIKGGNPLGTHGFGNFWVVNHLRNGNINAYDWLNDMPDRGFCDVKGYMLPMIKGGLRGFIQEHSLNLVIDLKNFILGHDNKVGIKDIVDEGNRWLLSKGFKRQNFVLTAFAMDMAEYFPDLVDQDSDVYVGSNAKKCLKLIMPGVKTDKALRYLCEASEGISKPYDMEDVACDFIRYIENFQSPDHIKANNGIKYYNSYTKSI